MPFADSYGPVLHKFPEPSTNLLRPSRRSNLMRPSVVMPAMSRPVARVAIVVDTSGSMDEIALTVALTEASAVIAEGAAAREPVAVVACDQDVQRTSRVMTATNLQLVGGGGTDMGKGIEAAARLRPRPQLIVVLTDGYTPWPKRAPAGTSVVVALIGKCMSAPNWARSYKFLLATFHRSSRRPHEPNHEV